MVNLKHAALGNKWFRAVWGSYRSGRQRSAYVRRREHYEREAAQRNIRYRPQDSRALVGARLAARGYVPTTRRLGDIHTFAWVPMHSWHESLLTDLRELGEVSAFDYTSLGMKRSDLVASNPRAVELRASAARVSMEQLREAHRRRPVDWIFVYGNGREVDATWVRQVTEELGVPIVNMCLDDKQSWEGERIGEQRSGQIDIASAFDLVWTSSRIATSWYLLEGGIPLYLPEGFDAQRFAPRATAVDLDVSFVGGAYGFRPKIIDMLRKAGVRIHAFGAGWGGAMPTDDDVVAIFNRSKINLGMGGVGYDPTLTTLKGRDFDVPGTGGGMYLTSYNPELAENFTIAQEVACYSTTDELLELIRYYLRHDDDRVQMAERARARSLREHRWLHRYTCVLRTLGVMAQETP